MLRQILSSAGQALTKWGTARAYKKVQRGYGELIRQTGVNSDWLMAYAGEEADAFQNAYALTGRVRDLFRTNPTYQKVRETLIANVFGFKGVMCLMDIREANDRVVENEKEKASLLNYERRINRLRAFGAKQAGRTHEHYRAFKLADFLETERGMVTWNILKTKALTVEGGSPNVYANKAIQDGWLEWQRAEYSDIRGRVNYKTHRHLRLMAAVRDGDCCIRMIKDKRVNKFGFTLQLINAEWLDRFYNATLDNGNVVRMGIEYKMTPWGLGERVAFYFIKRTERDWTTGARGSFAYARAQKSPMLIRVPAAEIIHYARCVDSDNTRPAPWVASTIAKARHIDQYLLYEVICAREACTKVGFLESNIVPDGGMDASDLPNPEDIVDEGLSPGQTKGLPFGVTYKERNPSHPNSTAPDFRKLILRDQCAGIVGVPYSVLAGDFEGINFSAGRLERLIYTEEWKMLQGFDTDYAEVPSFEGFAEMFLLSGLTDLPFENLVHYKSSACFISRRWAGVDEIKEVQAAALRVGNNLSCLTDECAERGVNFEQIAIARAEERELLYDLGLPLDPTLSGSPAIQDPNADPDKDTEDDEDKDKDELDMDAEKLKGMAEAYGIAVRAGVITPNADDETAIRTKLGLPPISAEVQKAWDNDGGARKPITLQGQKASLLDSGLNEDGTTIPKRETAGVNGSLNGNGTSGSGEGDSGDEGSEGGQAEE